MSKFFKSIGRFIDKKIVLPITKFFVKLLSIFKGNGRNFEIFLTKKIGLIVVSLILAIFIYLYASMKTTSSLETYAEVLYNQPISAAYNEEAYVIEGLPKTVDITLVGRKSDIYLAKQLPINDISVDLTGLEPGVHKVNLKYKKALSSVEYKLDPSVATIVIYKKETVAKELSYEVINKDKLESKYIVENVTLNKDKVYVKSKAATLENVVSVKALVDLSKLTDAQKTIGTQELKNVKLVAYDSNGKRVNAEVVPSTLTANVEISSPQKEVPIKVIPVNYDKLKSGKSIKEMTTDVTKVTVYGKSSILDKINYIPVEVDVSDLKENKKYIVSIVKPTGIRSISESTVNVNVELGESTYKEVKDIYIEYENLGEGLIINAADKNSTNVVVNVEGVSDVLNDLDPASIKAYIDLKDKGPGEYDIPVKVVGSDLRVKYKSKITKVKIIISEKK